MARITVEDCIDKFPSRFELVLVASNRARKLHAGETPTVEKDNDKNTVIALREIAQQTLTKDQLKNDLILEYQTATFSEDDEVKEISNISEDDEVNKDEDDQLSSNNQKLEDHDTNSDQSLNSSYDDLSSENNNSTDKENLTSDNNEQELLEQENLSNDSEDTIKSEIAENVIDENS